MVTSNVNISFTEAPLVLGTAGLNQKESQLSKNKKDSYSDRKYVMV